MKKIMDWSKKIDIANHRKRLAQLDNSDIWAAFLDIRQRDNDLLAQWPNARGLVDSAEWMAIAAEMHERGMNGL